MYKLKIKQSVYSHYMECKSGRHITDTKNFRETFQQKKQAHSCLLFFAAYHFLLKRHVFTYRVFFTLFCEFTKIIINEVTSSVRDSVVDVPR